MTPARPASSEPPANTMVKTRGTSWPSALTMLGCVSAAWMIRPMRVFFSRSQMVTSMAAETSSMKPRYAGKFSPYSENSGKSSDGGTR